MNPIYKFTLAVGSGTASQAYPLYGGDLAKVFEREGNQMFYRAKLNGSLSFVGPDFTTINTAAFDAKFSLKIYSSYDGGSTWSEYWRGKFYKTDCEFDEDSKSISVTPNADDDYEAVLAGLDKEYNLIDLAPACTPIKMDKRPMVQVYIPGDSVVACFLGGMWWEQECNEVDEYETYQVGGVDYNTLQYKYQFALNKFYTRITYIGTPSPALPSVLEGANAANNDGSKYFDFTTGGYRIIRQQLANSWDGIYITEVSSGTLLWSNNTVAREYHGTYDVTLQAVNTASGNITLHIETIPLYARCVCDVDSIRGNATFPIPEDDMCWDSRNYKRIIGYSFPDTMSFNTNLSSTPTKWGIYQPGSYYIEPSTAKEFYPVCRNSWGAISAWYSFPADPTLVQLFEQSARAELVLKDAYPLWSVISVLLGEVAPGITHDKTTTYSQFLYGSENPISHVSQTLVISPKSNLVKAGYDQPAQKAPITLGRVLAMLRDCFRCYWYIEDGKLKIEHVLFFRKGGSYTDDQGYDIDLTSQVVTRNGKHLSYATNKFTFDKPDMAARYQFSWMDDVTELFEGLPIDIVSNYVNPDNTQEVSVDNFTSDADYILLNPETISLDGFVLFAAVEQSAELVESTTQNRALLVTGDTAVVSGYQVSNKILVNGQGITSTAEAPSGSIYATYLVYDANDNLIRFGSSANYEYQPGDHSVRFTFYSTANAHYSTLMLPYVNFVRNYTDHYLQNAYVAFIALQTYYKYDMPAKNYKIDGTTYTALGVKRLKHQTLNFPAPTDPNLLKLVKTSLGEGEIQKISINLSSRNAKVDLMYDTE